MKIQKTKREESSVELILKYPKIEEYVNIH